MNKIAFYLLRPNGHTPTTVFLRMRMHYRQVKIYTGISVLPRHWNFKRQRVKSSAQHAALFNDRLDRIASEILQILLDLENNNIHPTPQLIERRYKALRGERNTAVKSVFDCWEEWLTATAQSKSQSTIKNYRGILNHLKAFSKDRGYTVTFDGMDRHFINSMIDYLLKVVNMTNATLWNFFKAWKAFMKWANENGLTNNQIHTT